jgi:hypothetical protein
MRQLQPRGITFDIKSWLLSSSSCTRDALAALLTQSRLGAQTFVSRSAHDHQKGCAQVRARPNGMEWDLCFLAPSLDDHRDASRTWHDLLTHIVVLAGQQEVSRVYARSPERPEIDAVFRSAGFTVVSREEVFVRVQSTDAVPLPKGMRPADRDDFEALVGLCREALPPLVRKAELSAPDWCGARTLALGQKDHIRPQSASAFVCTSQGTTIGYLSLRQGPGGYWLEAIVHPDYRGDMLPYVRFVLSLSDCSPSKPIYCSVSDFTVGMAWILRTLGFVPYKRQVLFVAHPVVRVRVKQSVVFPGLEGSVESLGPRIQRCLDRPIAKAHTMKGLIQR